MSTHARREIFFSQRDWPMAMAIMDICTEYKYIQYKQSYLLTLVHYYV